MIRKIATAAVYIEDQQSAVQFWTKQVGFEVRRERPMGPNARWIEVGPPGADSILAAYPCRPPAIRGLRARIAVLDELGFYRLHFARDEAPVLVWRGSAPETNPTLSADYLQRDPTTRVELEEFTDIVGRHFKQPKEGLGFDASPSAHMWRTINFPTRYL
jgi:hypothetical protein